MPHFLTDPALNVQEVTVRLLERIITHPICGTFEPGASFVARAPESGHLLGFVLASRMGADQGHVSEVAVDPDASQRGIGKALVTKALDALQKLGCRRRSGARASFARLSTPACPAPYLFGFKMRRVYEGPFAMAVQRRLRSGAFPDACRVF